MFQATMVFALLVAFGITNAQTAQDPASVRSLVERGDFAAAYTRAQSLEDRLGEPEFDYFFGLAALETGHNGEAILALERYLARFPDSTVARFQLARALFAGQEDEAARIEFQGLVNAQPAELAAAAKRFLLAIDQRDRSKRPSWQGFAEAGVGRDSNVTTGIASGTQPEVPGFGILPVQPDLSSGVAASDTVISLGAGVTRLVPMGPYMRASGTVAMDTRRMRAPENSMFDQSSVRVEAALAAENGAQSYRTALSVSQTWIDNQRYQSSPSLAAEWGYEFSKLNRLGLSLQLAKLTYTDGCSYFVRDKATPCIPNDASTRNAQLQALGLGWTHRSADPAAATWTVSTSAASERNMNDTPALSRRIHSVRLGWQKPIAEKHVLSAGTSWQRSQYLDIYPVADRAREDTLSTAELAWLYQWTPNWLIRTDLIAARQRSNIGLYVYGREQLNFAVRRTF